MLTPTIFTQEFDDFMKRFISLNDEFQPIYSNGQISPSVGDYPSRFASAYETYSLSGVVPGALHGSQSPSILESFFRSHSTSITQFATSLADYWSSVLLVPGPPAHGGIQVLEVTNDASSQVSAFESAIRASITTSLVTPVFSNLINNIETIALPTVTWTVTELVDQGGGNFVPEDFFETIS